jgi:N-acetyltransferase 10
LDALTRLILGDFEKKDGWIYVYFSEFRRRFISLLGFEFHKFSPHFAVSIMQPPKGDPSNKASEKNGTFDCFKSLNGLFSVLPRRDIELFLSNSDFKRLSQYTRNMADRHLITDLLPTIAQLYFNGKIDSSVRILNFG